MSLTGTAPLTGLKTSSTTLRSRGTTERAALRLERGLSIEQPGGGVGDRSHGMARRDSGDPARRTRLGVGRYVHHVVAVLRLREAGKLGTWRGLCFTTPSPCGTERLRCPAGGGRCRALHGVGRRDPRELGPVRCLERRVQGALFGRTRTPLRPEPAPRRPDGPRRLSSAPRRRLSAAPQTRRSRLGLRGSSLPWGPTWCTERWEPARLRGRRACESGQASSVGSSSGVGSISGGSSLAKLIAPSPSARASSPPASSKRLMFPADTLCRDRMSSIAVFARRA